MDLDSDEKLFSELSSISIFEERRLIIIREVKKLKTKKSREEFLKYIEKPNRVIVLVIISNEYDLRNSLLKNIALNSIFIDIRTPFKQKMKEWVRYILKNKKINITNEALLEYIRIYGDSVSHVISEIEKTFLYNNEKIIDLDNMTNNQSYDRGFQLWHLQDSLAEKQFNESIEIYNALIQAGIAIPKIIINLFNLYQQMLWNKMGFSKTIGYTGINKIITSKLNKYNVKYTDEEIINIIQELRRIDILTKTTSINKDLLVHPLITKICKNIYV